MKAISRFLLLPLAVIGWAAADVPKKAPLNKYIGLYTNSPFTSKPPPPEGVVEANPLEDYALLGVSPIGVGYRVTLINKKKPDERITVDSDRPKEGFKILAVVRKSGDPLGTVVRMASGAITGTLAFDEKLLTIAAAAPQNNQQPPQGAVPQPGGQAPQPPPPGQQPQRQPRPRVVPPPAPPGQAQPVQPQPAQNLNRPDRRNR